MGVPVGTATTAVRPRAGRRLRVVVADGPREPLSRRIARLSHHLGIRAFGWGLLLASVALGAVGLIVGWWEFTTAAIAGLVVFALSLLFMIGRPTYAVQIGLPQTRVVVGNPAAGELTSTNAAPRRLLGTRMELPIGHSTAAFMLPSLSPGASHTDTFVIPTRRRGVVVVGPARSVQGDPFGVTGRERRWADPIEVFVHPRTVSLPGRQAGFIHDLEGNPTQHLTASDMSFHALRTYVPGDDPRHVHWRSSARTGELMVRQFEQTRQSRVAVGLDIARESYTSETEFELAVSAAASCALQAIREENPLSLLTTRALLPTVSGPRTLDELARVEWSGRFRAHELGTEIADLERSASIVIMVTGGGLPLVGLRKSCAQFDVDVRVIGVRVAENEAVAVRETANQSIITIASLDDLPRTMRRVMQ